MIGRDKQSIPRRCLLAVLVLLVAGTASTDAFAAKHKQKAVAYYGHIQASGEWHLHWSCLMDSSDSSWQLETLYGKSILQPAGQLDQTLGGASGRIDASHDRLCNGHLETATCGVGLADTTSVPLFLEKVKGGLRVDFEPPVEVLGCAGFGGVSAYGAGFEADNRVTRNPSGVIPTKKIGKKTIVVPISGSDAGSVTGGYSRSFSGTMSGTLTLTRKPVLLPVSP
jgi:hypothetical protein